MKNKILYLFVLAILAITGCKEKIDITLKNSYERLVVDGCLTNEAKRHTVKLSLTSNYFANEPQPKATGAIVTLSDDSSTVTLTETFPGIYQTDSTYKGKIGKTYILDIIYNGEEYSASSLLKYVAPIDSISFGPDPWEPDKRTINLWAMEPATTGDYYQWLYYVNDTLKSDSIKNMSFADDGMVNGNYMNGFPIFSWPAKPNDTVTLEMRSITKEYYTFIYNLYSEIFGSGSPFSGPPANVKGNVRNLTNSEKDVMGFFITSAVTRKTRIFK